MRQFVLTAAAVVLLAGLNRLAAAVPVPCPNLALVRPARAAAGGPADVATAPAWLSDEETLHFDAEPDRGVNISGAYEYAGGIRITAPETLTVTAVLFYLTENADLATVYIRGAGSEAQPGPVLDSFRTNSSGAPTWKRANLPRPVVIPAGSDFWPTVTVRHASGMHPLTLDLGPLVAWRGGYIMVPLVGQTWYQLTDPPFWTDRNWNIRAVVQYGLTGIEEKLPRAVRPDGLTLSARLNRDRISCSFELAHPADAELSVFDQRGSRVRVLVRGRLPQGPHRVTWDGRDDNAARVPSGAYFLALRSGTRLGLERVTLLR